MQKPFLKLGEYLSVPLEKEWSVIIRSLDFKKEWPPEKIEIKV